MFNTLISVDRENAAKHRDDRIAKFQSVTEKISDLRGYITMPRLDEVTKTQSITSDEVTNTQSVTETISDIRIHINRGQPGALEYESTNVRYPKHVNLAKKVMPLSLLKYEELRDANPKRYGSCNNCRVCIKLVESRCLGR